jgi:hypothetical protein
VNIDFGGINYLVVGGIVIGNMILGAAWYSVFANPWLKAMGKTREELQAMGTKQAYGIAIVSSIILALALAVLVQATGASSLIDGLVLALIVGGGFVAATHAPTNAFSGQSLNLSLINAGYPVVAVFLWAVVLTLF